jgi:hypothetical protein
MSASVAAEVEEDEEEEGAVSAAGGETTVPPLRAFLAPGGGGGLLDAPTRRTARVVAPLASPADRGGGSEEMREVGAAGATVAGAPMLRRAGGEGEGDAEDA